MTAGDHQPRVVALGGGYGLSTSLRAIRRYAHDITGIVSVADDGGSSGRLRRAFGIPAPGDLRRCLVALAEPDSPWAEAFEHRFAASELEGHPLGNILIAGLAETTGDFGEAIRLALRLLGGVGQVIPATKEPVALKATWEREQRGVSTVGEVEGEHRVGLTAGITGVSVVPPDPEVPAEAIAALAAADQIVIGPGSLYTSILAVVAVPGIREAIAASSAQRVYVANLAEQHPETTGYDVAAHVAALQAHGVEIDVVVHDPDCLTLGDLGACSAASVLCAPIARANHHAHDVESLADALVSAFTRAAASPA